MKSYLILTLSIIASSYSLLAQRSGLAGKVTEVIGNQMPSSSQFSKGKVKTVAKEIYIFQLTSEKQASKDGLFYKNITTQLITKKKTKADGTYKLKLKPGHYSVFIKENDGLYANSLDGEGNINAVIIEPKKITLFDLRIDYNASY